ncbi:MAG: YhgE/Pip domain-containing protein [Streptococcus sp.]|nr:YhgE/Pip domain-containing protein [Streptococcus sp.]
MNKIKKIIGKYKLWIMILGVSCIPALYNLSFLGSMWNPYGNVSNLPVAVVNKDKSISMNEKTIAIGQDITNQMKTNKSLSYHFVEEKEASTGLKNGKYYMIVTLPDNLSSNSSTLLSENPKQTKITYETAQGNNLFASKVSSSAIDKLKSSVSKNITETYTKSVFSQLSQLQNGLNQLSTGSQKISDGSEQLYQGSQTMTTGLGQLTNGGEQIANGTDNLTNALTTYTSGVGQLNNGISSLSSGISTYTVGVGKLANGSNQLNASSASLVDGFQNLADGSKQLNQLTSGLQSLKTGLDGANQLSQASLQQLVTLQEQLNSYTNQPTTTASPNRATLQTEITNLKANVEQATSKQTEQANAQLSAIQATATYQSLTDEQKSELTNALSATNDTSLQNIQTSIQNIENLLNAETSTSNTIDVSTSQVTLATASQYLTQLHQLISQQLTSGTSQLIDGSTQFQTALTNGNLSIQSGLTQYTNSVSTLNNGLNQLNNQSTSLLSGTKQLQSGSQQLANNSHPLVMGSQQLATGIHSENSAISKLYNGSDQLTNGLTSLSTNLSTLTTNLSRANNQLSLVSVTDKNAKNIASPVTLKHTDHDSVAVNGVGMAPYMISVSLMVIALSANVIFEKLLYGSTANNKKDLLKKKILINSGVALLDSIILYGVLLLMGVKMAHPVLTFEIILLGSYVFMAMVTLLVSVSEQLGSFISLLLLLLQTGASGGSYPIELSPRFFQIVHPYLPMSYLVSGLRQTISRTGDIGEELMVLLLFLLTFSSLIFLVTLKKKRRTFQLQVHSSSL